MNPEQPQTPTTKMGRPRKDAAEKTTNADGSTDSESVTPKPKRQERKNVGEGSNGAWTDEEHARFCEGVRAWGKNWDRVVPHVGTRTR